MSCGFFQELLDSDQLDERSADPLWLDRPVLAECYGAAAQGSQRINDRVP